MKTLEQVKKEKNYNAHIKGYPIDPEGFSITFLYKRLDDEYKELQEARIKFIENEVTLEDIISELGDLSNLIDYLSTKIIVNYPTKYHPEETDEVKK